jgi:hypothetical protein
MIGNNIEFRIPRHAYLLCKPCNYLIVLSHLVMTNQGTCLSNFIGHIFFLCTKEQAYDYITTSKEVLEIIQISHFNNLTCYIAFLLCAT